MEVPPTIRRGQYDELRSSQAISIGPDGKSTRPAATLPAAAEERSGQARSARGGPWAGVECHSGCGEDGLSVAADAARVWAVANGLRILQPCQPPRGLARGDGGVNGARAGAPRSSPGADRGQRR